MENVIFELLKQWGIDSELLCDPIFSTKIDETEKNNTIAIQLRNFHTMNEDFIDRLAQKVCLEFSDKKVEIYSLIFFTVQTLSPSQSTL